MLGLSAAALCAAAGTLMMPAMAAAQTPFAAPQGQILMIHPGARVPFSDPTWAIEDRKLSSLAHYQAARSLGYTVANITKGEWPQMTEASFKMYKAIFITQLGTGEFSEYAFLGTSQTKWVPAIKVNTNAPIMLSGAPISMVASQAVATSGINMEQMNTARINAQIVVKNAINFATNATTGTGLYLEVPMTPSTTTTTDQQTDGQTVGFLSDLGVFSLRVFGNNPPTGGTVLPEDEVEAVDQEDVALIARHPALANLNTALASNWGVSVRSVFAQVPTAYKPVYVAPDVAGIQQFSSTPFGAAAIEGPAVIIARGTGLESIPESCGDAMVEHGDQCDPGSNQTANFPECNQATCYCRWGMAADSTCIKGPRCGDFKAEPLRGEECDLGSSQLGGLNGADATSTCTEDCRCRYGGYADAAGDWKCYEECGNGSIEDGEQCDAGVLFNGQASSLCDDTCQCAYGYDTVTSSCKPCGDGKVQSPAEQCDLGFTRNGVDGELCDETCQCRYGSTYDSVLQVYTCKESCGDGSLNVETGEECDDSDDPLCASDCKCLYGLAADSTADEPTCALKPICGNEIIEFGEQCDDKEDDNCTKKCQCLYGLDEETGDCFQTQQTTTATSAASTETSATDASTIATMTDGSTTTDATETGATETGATETGATETETATETGATDTATETGATETAQTETATQTQTATITATGNMTMTSAASTTSTTGPSQTDGPLPAEIEGDDGVAFSRIGCAASSQNYRGFSLEAESDDMDLVMCANICKEFLYSGTYKNQCYCGNELDESELTIVENAACDIQCPGNELQNCGGDLTSSGKLKVRQVPAGRLLSLYIRIDVEVPGSTTLTSTATGSLSAPLTSQTASQTATATAGSVVINNNNNNINIDIDIDIILVPFLGDDCLGERVYIKSCDVCKVGEKPIWAPKRCANAGDCTGMKVYKPEQCSNSNGNCDENTSKYDFVVEKPCDACDGGVTYQPKDQWAQPSPQPQQTAAPEVTGHTGYDHPVMTAGSGRLSALQSLVAGFAVNAMLAGLFL